MRGASSERQQLWPSVSEMVSTYHPMPPRFLSHPRRHRNRMGSPAAEGGRITVVVTNPPELPLQAGRPASGFWYRVDMVTLYPFSRKEPPALRISVNAPSLMAISSTPPSNPALVPISKL